MKLKVPQPLLPKSFHLSTLYLWNDCEVGNFPWSIKCLLWFFLCFPFFSALEERFLLYSWKFFCFVFVTEGKSRLHFEEDFGLGLTSVLSSVCTEFALKVFNFRLSVRSDKWFDAGKNDVIWPWYWVLCFSLSSGHRKLSLSCFLHLLQKFSFFSCFKFYSLRIRQIVQGFHLTFSSHDSRRFCSHRESLNPHFCISYLVRDVQCFWETKITLQLHFNLKNPTQF